ncbi:MAG: DUF6600 domain-containing protein [Rhizobacter sp.]
MKHQELAALSQRTFASPAHWLGLLFGLLLLTLLALPVRAAESGDPPDRVGRLSELNGQVWIYATDSNEWIAATRNRPVTTGDRLSTENDGRAEVRVGSTVVRIAPNTEIEVLQLDDDHVSLELHSGSLTARLRTRDAANQFGLTTEEGRFRTDRTGNYRFDRIDDTSHATALSGQLVYEGDGTELAVQQGQRVEFWKERGAAQYSISSPRRDEFGDWVASRDAGEERSVSTRYVSAEMTGVEDLDRYGRWEQSPEYGAIWTPREVAADWAPYRMGHWAWVSPWGWTWVDDAPWGFAPFHYGRWVWFRDSWSWMPGRYVARPVYAPAMVAWVGGPNVSVSVSVGRTPTVGWFPLAPHEVYVPGYRVSPHYVRNVNVTQVTNITNVTTIISNPAQFMAGTRYVNRGLPHAVTVVPASVIERRQPVAPAITTVNDRVLRDMGRERPRADAPVVAPPRWTPGARQIEDPRMSRPGFAPNPRGAPPSQQPGMPRPVGNADNRPAPPAVGGTPTPGQVQPAPGLTQRPQEPPRDRERDRDRRGRDAPIATVPAMPANTAHPVANAPPPAPVAPPAAVVTPVQRGVRSNPPTPAPVASPARPPEPDRALAPQREGRVGRNEMPGPPKAAVQAPPARQPQTQAPAPQPPKPPVAPTQAPPMHIPEAQRPREPKPEAQQRPREERPNERGGDKERGSERERNDRR